MPAYLRREVGRPFESSLDRSRGASSSNDDYDDILDDDRDLEGLDGLDGGLGGRQTDDHDDVNKGEKDGPEHTTE